MAQEYDKYGDSYSKYPTDDKKYECKTGPFEGFFVSSVEFCKQFKFDKDNDRKDNNRTGTQGPPSPAGPAGSQGFQGIPGSTGVTGATGQAGITTLIPQIYIQILVSISSLMADKIQLLLHVMNEML
jgi:hypothetical protein